jgi:hypothetical protein
MEVLERILAYLPRYFSDLYQLVGSPKRFAKSNISDDMDSFNNALIYYAITTVVIAILPLPSRHNYKEKIELFFLLNFIMFPLSAWTLRLFWRMAGAIGKNYQFFGVFIYLSTTWVMMNVFVMIAAILILQTTSFF